MIHNVTRTRQEDTYTKNKADYNFKCHNCGMTRSFTYFLKDRDRPLYDEYVMERFKEGLTGKGLLRLNQNLHFLNLSSERKIYAMNLQKSQN